jgi:hypothetical protein
MSGEQKWCPYNGCTFTGTDDQVDEHRIYAHQNETQAGSNLSQPPRRDYSSAFRSYR